MQASTALAVRAPATALIETLIVNDENALEQLKAALPANVTATRFIAALKTALIDDAIDQRDESKRLLTANPASLFQAVVKCAQDGLLPDRREAALVRFGNNVQYLPQVLGVRKIAAGFGWTIRTHVIYANDEFAHLQGTREEINHRPVAPGGERGEVVGAYAVATHRTGRGDPIIEVYNKEQIEEARAKSKMPNGPAWTKSYPQMAEKTLAHRIAKKLPLDPQDAQRLMRVIEASEIEPGQASEILYGTSGSPAEGEAARTLPPSTDGTDPGGTIQQAGDASAAGPSPAPGSEEEDFGGVEFGEPEPDADPDIAAAQAASTYVVEAVRDDVWVKGLTLAQINARGEEGEQFFRWALNPAKNAGAELRAQADAYAKVQLPALWAEFARVS